ncbi:hypothetical protein EVAR_81139_1 [Eumeta japonica]|uniref:Uncharacterized protein n=1 Tax=Eumeta variegata TaxID=151549 RepID=A0A4C1ULN3_EUMVA|nr:hypothetical protein EVAR_81139_1 [Eumeta japonica]
MDVRTVTSEGGVNSFHFSYYIFLLSMEEDVVTRVKGGMLWSFGNLDRMNESRLTRQIYGVDVCNGKLELRGKQRNCTLTPTRAARGRSLCMRCRRAARTTDFACMTFRRKIRLKIMKRADVKHNLDWCKYLDSIRRKQYTYYVTSLMWHLILIFLTFLVTHVYIVENIWYQLLYWNTSNNQWIAGFSERRLYYESYSSALELIGMNRISDGGEISAGNQMMGQQVRVILRLVYTSRPGVNACGLMELHAGLAPTALSLAAHYTILMLQFMNLI